MKLRSIDRKKFRDFWIKRSDHVTASFPLERWNTYENEVHSEINDPCENLWDRMYIWFDGIVNPCDADYKSFLSFGNVNNSTIKDIRNKIVEYLDTKFKGNENFKKIVNSSAFCSENNNIVSDNYKITSNEKIAIIPPIGGG